MSMTSTVEVVKLAAKFVVSLLRPGSVRYVLHIILKYYSLTQLPCLFFVFVGTKTIAYLNYKQVTASVIESASQIRRIKF